VLRPKALSVHVRSNATPSSCRTGFWSKLVSYELVPIATARLQVPHLPTRSSTRLMGAAAARHQSGRSRTSTPALLCRNVGHKMTLTQRELTADERDRIAAERDYIAQVRDHAADQRDDAADGRDQVRDKLTAIEQARLAVLLAEAGLTDQAAERRDRAGETRDVRADHRDTVTGRIDVRAIYDRRQAALDRVHSGRDRDRAAVHRCELLPDGDGERHPPATDDRSAAAQDRAQSQSDRKSAHQDRDQANVDRQQAEHDRSAARDARNSTGPQP